jgi:Predicted nucleic-acid-binding protein implicated in transcription termination
VVRTPEGLVVLDPTGKMPGRGAYVCESKECRKAALDKGSLQRALEVPIPVELRAELTGEASRIEEGGSRGQE